MAEVRINTGDEIDLISAKLCLLIAGTYAEEHDMRILGERDEDGKVVYWFEERK